MELAAPASSSEGFGGTASAVPPNHDASAIHLAVVLNEGAEPPTGCGACCTHFLCEASELSPAVIRLCQARATPNALVPTLRMGNWGNSSSPTAP